MAALWPAAAQTYVLSNAWRVATGTGHVVATGDDNRGLAYSVAANRLFVANKRTPAVDVFDGSTGALLGSADVTGISGGTFVLNQLAAGDDGALYTGNLTTSVGSSSPYKLYRWSDWAAAPTLVYSDDPTGGATLAGKRMGDSLVATGAGANTILLAGLSTSSPGPTTNVVLFSSSDGVSFTATLLSITGLPALAANGAAYGFAFFTNNTFLMKPPGASVYLVQFPANFASLGGTATGTVIGTYALSGNNVLLDYSVSARYLAALGPVPNAGSATTTTPIALYGVPPFTGLTASLATTSSPHPNANGNFVGAVALGGAGKTNFIYSVDCNNGVQASAILLVPPQPPSITTGPVGATIYPPYTLTVTAGGTKPLHYQWQSSLSTNVSGFSDIPGATTNFYTVTTPSTNYYRVVITNALGAVTSAPPVLVTILTPVSSVVVTQLWRIPSGAAGYAYLGTDNNTRGLAYDANSGRVIVSSMSGGTAICILDANTGTNIGTMNLTGATLNGYAGISLDQVGIAGDGAVYAGNLAYGGSTFNLNRWEAPTTNATATLAYSGYPMDLYDRWGDTMAVRGAGANTQILLGSRNGTNVALFTSFDGMNYSPTVIAVTNAPAGFAANGVAFGAGNTLWAKSYLGDLWQIAFDPASLVGYVVFHYPQPSQIPPYLVGVGVDSVRKVLAGIVLSDSPHDVQMFQLTGTADAPVLFSQSFFASANANGNGNVAIAMSYPRIYALDVNNGLLALAYDTPPTTPPFIAAPPANQTVYTNNPALTFTVSVSGSLPLYYQWRFNGVSIVGATNRTYTIPYPPPSAAGLYDVIVRNIAGSATSSPPAVLTILQPVSSLVVTQLWALPGGSRAYLDSSAYNTRGLAYDPNTGTLLVCDHENIHVLSATNGDDLFALNTLGLPAGYFTLDQVGVADDGVVYACNLSLDGLGFAITRWDSVSLSAGLYPAYGPADPSGGTGERWGDTLVVRGAGVNTEILLGSYGGTNVVLLTTTDGQSFAPTLIGVAGVPGGFAGQGLAFGTGKTFWAKSPGFNLRQVAYDTSTTPASATVVQAYVAGTEIDSSLGGVGVDAARQVLAGVGFNDTPHDLRLYQLSGNANPPALLHQAFFASNNLNSQMNSVTTLKGGRAFGLDVNNGLVALSYSTPPPPRFSVAVSYARGSGATLTWPTFNGYTYQVMYKNALTDAVWTPLGPAVVASGPSGSYTDSGAPGSGRYYRVLGY